MKHSSENGKSWWGLNVQPVCTVCDGTLLDILRFRNIMDSDICLVLSRALWEFPFLLKSLKTSPHEPIQDVVFMNAVFKAFFCQLQQKGLKKKLHALVTCLPCIHWWTDDFRVVWSPTMGF